MGKHKNSRQEKLLLDFMEENRDLARGFTKREKYHVESLWSDLAKNLNSQGPPTKDVSGWKKFQYFSDSKHVKVIDGKGGDGCISFLSLWCNERAGPDGGDGGNGGHIVFKDLLDVKNFNHVDSVIKSEEGEKGANKDCHGKNANHNFIKVPLGTVIKNDKGKIVADLNDENLANVNNININIK